jgi:hypothetical protein
MLLAISDICADLGEASLGTRGERRFMWRHMRRFLSSQNAAALCAFAGKLEPNFSFSLHGLTVCFLSGARAISR